MPWTDNLPKAVQDSIREAGRGHLLGDYRSPLDVADEARKRSKEEPPMNTDKQEALARQAGTFVNEKSEGVTSGVQDGDTQGQDAQRVDPAADQVQNEGEDGGDIEPEGGDETEDDADDDSLVEE